MKRTKQVGLSLVEVIVAIGIFALVAGVGYQAYEISHAAVAREDDRAQASQYAAEGIEAARYMRDQDFANLTAGSHGISSSTGGWQFSGSSDIVGDFSRTVTVSLADTDTANVSSTVTWGSPVSYQIARSAQLTNWRKEVITITMADAFSIDASGQSLSNRRRYVDGIVLISDGSVSTVEIVTIEASWSGVSSNRRLRRIYAPLSTRVWNGSEYTPATASLNPTITLSGATTEDIQFQFSSSVHDADLDLTFIMSDGSSYTAPTITNL